MAHRTELNNDSTQGFERDPSGLGALHAKLESASKADLIALVKRLATDSDALAARIDYLTNPDTAANTLQHRIKSIRGGFIRYAEVREVAAEIDASAADIRTDVLPRNPMRARTLAEKLFSLDQVIFNRADDSSGAIGAALRDACVLWLDAAAGDRAASPDQNMDWASGLYKLYQANDYGIREPLLQEANRLLRENELRALAARFERGAQEILELVKYGKQEFHRVFSPTSAIGLVARALRDPTLCEKSIRIYSPDPNELQAAEIANCYPECRDVAEP
jgi:uncharacterized protein YigA (DUF484 family)